MKKTFITSMPDHAGAFLAAGRIIAAAGGNITRVSYNKAVDTHMLFLDVSGDEAQLDAITGRLSEIGYIQDARDDGRVMLLSFTLPDVPGALLPVLESINRFAFNISYISAQENGSGWQDFKMGLFVEDPHRVRAFLDEAQKLCEVRVIEYDESERVLDNTVFYMRFADRLAKKLALDREQAMELVAQSNRIMQMLDERREPPYKTFDYIGRSADMLVRWKGAAYVPRITRLALRDGFGLLCVEPPCGSNTYVYHKDGALLLIDGGFPCYAPELTEVLRREIPGFDGMRKQMLLTHPDTDHCGLMEGCEAIWVSPVGWQHFDFENRGLPNFREQNPVHAPYVRIHQILSRYRPPRMAQLRRVDEVPDVPERPLSLVGGVDFCGRRLAVYRGNGGHAPGEVAIVDETDRLVFSGDILVNPEGFIPAQAEFNRLAPYLMTSVNMDSRKAGQERAYLKKLFSPAEYRYCPGHGAIMELK